jgi:HSP20 family protein
MNMRDLIPWTRNHDHLSEFFRDERSSPFVTLHREMNRLLEEAFRGFAFSSLAGHRTDFVNPAWPKLEVAETEKQIAVSAEIPGMEEKDVEVLLNDGSLIIRGEMKSETEDKERQFSERFYGRFERQIPVGLDIDESKVEALFKNGILKVILPKTERAQTKAKRIAINPTKH